MNLIQDALTLQLMLHEERPLLIRDHRAWKVVMHARCFENTVFDSSQKIRVYALGNGYDMARFGRHRCFQCQRYIRNGPPP